MKIAFVDLETTGLDPEKENIIEAACIVADVSPTTIKIKKTLYGKVKPFAETNVSDFIRNLTGYNEEQWEKESVDELYLYKDILESMEGCWHAGSNPIFDSSFLKVAAERHKLPMPKLASYHLLDVTNLYFDLLINETLDKLKQETVAKYLEIDGGGHRALSDATQCLKIFARKYNLTLEK